MSIVKWLNSQQAILEVDEAEYMMLVTSLTMCLKYPLPFNNIHNDMVNGLDLRNKVKQIERRPSDKIDDLIDKKHILWVNISKLVKWIKKLTKAKDA